MVTTTATTAAAATTTTEKRRRKKEDQVCTRSNVDSKDNNRARTSTAAKGASKVK